MWLKEKCVNNNITWKANSNVDEGGAFIQILILRDSQTYSRLNIHSQCQCLLACALMPYLTLKKMWAKSYRNNSVDRDDSCMHQLLQSPCWGKKFHTLPQNIVFLACFSNSLTICSHPSMHKPKRLSKSRNSYLKLSTSEKIWNSIHLMTREFVSIYSLSAEKLSINFLHSSLYWMNVDTFDGFIIFDFV
mgnify:CR=1 FL=1